MSESGWLAIKDLAPIPFPRSRNPTRTDTADETPPEPYRLERQLTQLSRLRHTVSSSYAYLVELRVTVA